MMICSKTQIKGVRGGNKGEKRKFSLYLGEKISFGKGGVGKIINYLDYKHPCHNVSIETAICTQNYSCIIGMKILCSQFCFILDG